MTLTITPPSNSPTVLFYCVSGYAAVGPAVVNAPVEAKYSLDCY